VQQIVRGSAVVAAGRPRRARTASLIGIDFNVRGYTPPPAEIIEVS